MNISYEKVFDRYFGLIDDVKELSLEESDLYEILAGRLHSAISDPFIRRLFSTLKLDDEIQQLEFELTTSVDEYSMKNRPSIFFLLFHRKISKYFPMT